MTDAKNAAPRGVRWYVTDEQILAYRALSPEQKLEWLQAAWQLTVDGLTPERYVIWDKLRRGEI